MKKGEKIYQTYQLDHRMEDPENRSVTLAWASDKKVLNRATGEVLQLSLSADSVDVSVLAGGPLLLQHDHRQQIGVIDSAWVDPDGMARARVRFSRSAQGSEILQDIRDGIRRSVSVGFFIEEMKRAERKGTYIATKWSPIEISIVSVPMDTSVGVGRSDCIFNQNQGDELPMTIKATDDQNSRTVIPGEAIDNNLEQEVKRSLEQEAINCTEESTEEQKPAEVLELARDQARQEEAKRVREIMQMGKQFKRESLADQYIADGVPADKFRAELMQRLKVVEGAPQVVQQTATSTRASHPSTIGLTSKEAQRFSFRKLLLSASSPSDASLRQEAAFELDCCTAAEDLMRTQGRSTIHLDGVNLSIPYDVLDSPASPELHQAMGRIHTRSMTSSDGSGGDLIANDLLSGRFIDFLYDQMVIRALGATVMNGLSGNIDIPKKTNTAIAQWLSENQDVTLSDQGITQVPMRPKTIGAGTEYSRRLLKQSSIDVEAFIRSDLVRQIALGVDHAVINGTGNDNQPTGLLNIASGVGSVASVGGNATLGVVIDLETEVLAANVMDGRMGYLTSPRIRGKLKQTERFPQSNGLPIWTDRNSVNGYVGLVSNVVPSDIDGDKSALIFGNWADLILGFWSGIDINVNPYSLDRRGAVRITVFQDADIAVRHPESFAISRDLNTQ